MPGLRGILSFGKDLHMTLQIKKLTISQEKILLQRKLALYLNSGCPMYLALILEAEMSKIKLAASGLAYPDR